MERALYAKGWGYFSNGHVKFGFKDEGGDFGTGPQALSPFYGHMVADQVFAMWQGMRRAGTLSSDPDEEKFTVVEFGAGMGDLAYDFLKYVKNSFVFLYHFLKLIYYYNFCLVLEIVK